MPCEMREEKISNAFLDNNYCFVFMRNHVIMKRTLVLVFGLIATAITLSACQKTQEEKVAEALTEASSDKEIQRLNEMRKQGKEDMEKLLGSKKSISKESAKPTK